VDTERYVVHRVGGTKGSSDPFGAHEGARIRVLAGLQGCRPAESPATGLPVDREAVAPQETSPLVTSVQ